MTTLKSLVGWTEGPQYALELVCISKWVVLERPLNNIPRFSRHIISMYGDNMLYDVVQSWNKSEIVFYLDTHALYVGAQI